VASTRGLAHGPSQARCARERAHLVLAGCCDLDPARAEAFRRDFGYARAFTDPVAMLDAERPDAVVVVVSGRADGPRSVPSSWSAASRSCSRSRRGRPRSTWIA